MSESTLESLQAENAALKEIINHLELQLASFYSEKDENNADDLNTAHQIELIKTKEENP